MTRVNFDRSGCGLNPIDVAPQAQIPHPACWRFSGVGSAFAMDPGKADRGCCKWHHVTYIGYAMMYEDSPIFAKSELEIMAMTYL